MALPIVPLPTDTVTLSNGSKVEVRGLSRTEAGRIAFGEFKDQPADGEVFVLSIGCGVTEDEAREWLGATPPEDAGKVLDRILELSALTTKDADPQPSTSES